MADWITKKKKKQRGMGKPEKPKEKKFIKSGSKEIMIEFIKQGPRNELPGFKLKELKGGGIAQRGLGRAFNKGGKV